MREREFHAVADLFPLMQGAAFEELVADIKRNGLLEPILVDAEGRIVDGRNRYRACLAAGVEPRFVEWKGEGPLPELALSLNLRRRHLDESQRAMVAARLAKLLVAKRKAPDADRGADLLTGKFKKTRDEAAAMVNISPRMVIYASKVIKDGCPQLIAAVESGALALTPAAVLAKLPQEEQAQAVASRAKHAARKARAPRPSLGPFGVVGVKASDHEERLTLLWVRSRELADAISALKGHGFQHAPGSARVKWLSQR